MTHWQRTQLDSTDQKGKAQRTVSDEVVAFAAPEED